MVLISHELKNQSSEAMNADRDLVNRLKIVIHFFVEWKQTNRSQFSAKSSIKVSERQKLE